MYITDDKIVLITGASGLIGHNLLINIKNKVKKIIATEHNKSIQIPGIEYVKTDLNQTDCDSITKNVDIVFHCAAHSSGASAQDKNPLDFVRTNVIMNINLLESCHKNNVKKFIWLASTTGYPESDIPVTEDKMFEGDPYNKYFAVGWMKRYTEKLCELFSTKLKSNLTCIVLRPTNIYGPFDKIDPSRSHVLTALIRKVVEKQNPIEVWGDGTDERDVLYVSDMVDAMVLSTELNEFQQINIGYGKSYTVSNLLDKIKRIANYESNIKYILDAPRMIPKRSVNIEKAKSLLYWYPRVHIDNGIKYTYNWVKEELNKI